jgi:hypothetical protein
MESGANNCWYLLDLNITTIETFASNYNPTTYLPIVDLWKRVGLLFIVGLLFLLIGCGVHP